MATEVTSESVINALLDQIRDLSLKVAMLEAARNQPAKASGADTERGNG